MIKRMVKGHRQVIGWQDEQRLLSATNPTPAAASSGRDEPATVGPGLPLELTSDELLAATCSVRKRLDLTRPVERHVLAECLSLAQQAPTSRPRCRSVIETRAWQADLSCS